MLALRNQPANRYSSGSCIPTNTHFICYQPIAPHPRGMQVVAVNARGGGGGGGSVVCLGGWQ